MAERKVLNKYLSPDFDPAKISRRIQPKNQQMKVRMMLPMSIRCCTCGNYIYAGTKFNSRKEDVIGETYLGIKIFRFYFKCTRCSAEITYKTDPRNSDYVVEFGATRNFDRVLEEDSRNNVVDDVMSSLEKRALDLKREMDVFANLEELKSMKSIHASLNVDAMLESNGLKRERKLEEEKEEDEAIVKSIVFKGQRQPDVLWRRIEDDEDTDDEDDLVSKKRRKVFEEEKPLTKGYNGKFALKSRSIRISVKKPSNEEEKGTMVNGGGLLSLCSQYGDEEDEE